CLRETGGAARERLREALRDDPALAAWFEAACADGPAGDPAPPPRPKRYNGSHLHLDASAFGVTNVFDAAQLCEQLLGGKRDGLNCHLEPEADAGPPQVRSASEGTRPAARPEPVAHLQATELDLFRLLGERLPTRRMIDVGAHHGCTLEPFLNAGWDVDAFE